MVGGQIGTATLENNLAESVKAEHIITYYPTFVILGKYLREDVCICAQKNIQECL